MFYIDGPGATVDHKFTEGDPAAGVAATTVTDDFMNDVQQEILTVLQAAGIAPAKNTQDQLLKALRGLGTTGIFTTPPVFDNSKKGATTEFVQRALGNFQKILGIDTSKTLQPADAGSFCSLFGAGGINVQLPVGSSLPSGAAFTLFCVGTPGQFYVSTTGGNTITFNGADNVPGVDLYAGDFIQLVWSGLAWVGTGSVQTKYQPGFKSILQTSGFQKLPSGLIVQWGQTAPAIVGDVTTNLPIAFPSFFPVVVITQGYTPGTNSLGYACAGPISTSAFTWRGTGTGNGHSYIALGW
jgi:hypothetical protein